MQHEQQSRKEKPEKDSFIEYYILNPIIDIGDLIVTFFKWCWLKATGAWWCHHCSKWHGRRVRKYIYHDIICNTHIDRNICSLGRDAARNDNVQPNPDKRGDIKRMEDEVEKAMCEICEQISKDLTK